MEDGGGLQSREAPNLGRKLALPNSGTNLRDSRI